MKLPNTPSHDDLTARARSLTGQAAPSAAEAAGSTSRTSAETGRKGFPDAVEAGPGGARDSRPRFTGTPPIPPATPMSEPSRPRFTGTPFARATATAFASRPHARSLGSTFLGSDLFRTGFRLGGRESKRLRNNGFAPETIGASGMPELDLNELIHIHGRRLPSLMRSASSRLIKRDTRGIVDSGSATGSLHQVTVSERERAQGAMGWTRLCVDTDQNETFQLITDHHLDVVIAPVGRDPGEYAADMALILPRGIPPEAWRALTTDPAHPTARLHLLGQDRIGVDTGDRAYTLFRNVPHPVRGSLLVMGNRVTRAELWVTDRRNVTMWDWIPA